MKIDLGEILTILTFVVSLITAIEFLAVRIKKIINKAVEPINKKIDLVDADACKNYLVRFMKDVEQGEKLGLEEVMRAIETYDHYTNDLKANSYIHKKWEVLEPQINELMKEK